VQQKSSHGGPVPVPIVLKRSRPEKDLSTTQVNQLAATDPRLDRDTSMCSAADDVDERPSFADTLS
jgi:hypothetical protein